MVRSFRQITASVNYRIGNIINKLGYSLVRSDRVPRGNLNLLELAYAVLKLSNHERLFIIQIGAFDGTAADPLTRILRDQSAEAILIEPQGEPFHALERRYSDNPHIRLLNAAVSDQSGQGFLYVPVRHGSSSRASLLENHRLRFGQEGHQRIPVRLVTLHEVLATYEWHSCDLLQIDAEGYDLKILQTCFNLGIKPKVINLESFHLSRSERADLRETLKKKGYEYIDWKFDTLAIDTRLWQFCVPE